MTHSGDFIISWTLHFVNVIYLNMTLLHTEKDKDEKLLSKTKTKTNKMI